MPKQSEVEKLIRSEFNRIRGILAGSLEAIGLPEKQERAAISTLKTLSYEAEKNIINLLKE